ncbi:MAG: 30S ribosomal protein S16 [Salinivirgaceae bacterium]|jgi:small subunit ribosomal protein S16|nr:30S ribosomal protein S16 [Salinivirgaceae bacterium]
MPVRIRLQRKGRAHHPYYYIVVADSRAPRDGKFIERIGAYNPMTNPANIQLDFDKALSWLQNGAQPSETCRSILSGEGVMMYSHLMKGVRKGAFDKETADKKFEIWKLEKATKLQTEADKTQAQKEKEKEERFAHEKKVNEERAKLIAEKNAELNAVAEEEAKKEEAPAEESAEESVEAKSQEDNQEKAEN